ncbi:MAG: pilin [Candidatus Curtissbacteria bacterium]|nr:pilin [Candidatus Curtissbacteria bacterium]
MIWQKLSLTILIFIFLILAPLSVLSNPVSANHCSDPYVHNVTTGGPRCGRDRPPEGCNSATEEEIDSYGHPACFLKTASPPDQDDGNTQPDPGGRNTQQPGSGTSSQPCKGFSDCLKDIAVDDLKFKKEQDLVPTLVEAALKVVLPIAGMITVLFIIFSGIQFITSGGNPEAVGKARGRLMYAIIGFVIILLAFAILQVVNRLFLGTTIT